MIMSSAVRDDAPSTDLATASLPSYLDAPPPVEPRPPASIREIWHGMSAFIAELTQTPEPVAPPQPRPLGSTPLNIAGRPHDLSATFVRMIDVPADELNAAVLAWWRVYSRAGVLDVGRRLRLGRPEFRPEICGGWCVPGRLRRDPLWVLPPLAVTLELTPRMSGWSWLHLRPKRHIHPTWRYFRIGHTLVDEIIAGLTSVT
jgi:hypothetical protein